MITAQKQTETAIDEAMIDRLIRGFYARVRDDDVLGPIFAEKIEYAPRQISFPHVVVQLQERGIPDEIG